MDIQDNLLIENSTISVIPKKPTLEWLIPKKLSHIYVEEKRIKLDMSMTLQFSDETLFKIKLEWDPAELETQILPEGTSSDQVQAAQEEIPQTAYAHQSSLAVEGTSEVPEDIPSTPDESTTGNQVIPERGSPVAEDSAPTNEAIIEETSIITSESDESRKASSKQPVESSFVVTNPDLSNESVNSASPEMMQNNLQNLTGEYRMEEPDQLSDENTEDTTRHPIEINDSPAEKRFETPQVEEESNAKESLSQGDNEVSATLVESKPHTSTASKRVTPKSAVPTKPIKPQNVPIVAKKPTPIKKSISTAAVSEPDVKKVVPSSPRIVRKPSQQTIPRSTSSMSRQSSASSRSSHSFNRPTSQLSDLPKATRQTSIGSLPHSSLSSSPTTRRCDPQRLKSQIDFSHGSVSTGTSSRPVTKVSSSPSVTCSHKIPSRQELSARHLSTSFTIGKEEPSTGPTKTTAPPAWAKELRPYLNKGSTTIRL
ncbi:hypothetical protein DSO57_1018741 [Entomophthora muscae]|uniref:Uncharacterized protein n=1 Tax=Entomophthora muscae TaxID=34485 RepID=A0ACC2RVC8_9FUNG|nr:hypothetical protein DSO57_1018741 [Entomophthora muscae]